MSRGVEEGIEKRIDAQTQNWKDLKEKYRPLEFGECEAPPIVEIKMAHHVLHHCNLTNTDEDRKSEENQIGAEQQSYFPGDCCLSFHSHVGPGFFGDDEDGDVEKKTGELEDNEGDLWVKRNTNRVLPTAFVFGRLIYR